MIFENIRIGKKSATNEDKELSHKKISINS